MDEEILREKARSAIRGGKLPRRPPIPHGPGPGSEPHVQCANASCDIGCFAAWEFERLMSRPPWRILIVDDSEDVREMYAFYLREVGCHVEVAPDGAAGVQFAERGSFDVIVMDFAMPTMDGREATRRLKADERTRHIPIIILTGEANGGAAAALANGAASYCRNERVLARGGRATP